MLLKGSAMDSANFYLKKWRGVRCLFKSLLLADLLGSQYLLEILQSSLTVKNNENGTKVDVSKNSWDGERHFFSEMKERYKVSCVKILIFF